MPRKATISKEMIKNAGVQMILEGESLNVRAVANRLGCSIQPVFYNYATMDDLKADILTTVSQRYEEYMAENSKSDKYLPYMAIGMSYIGFARDYPQFFKMLFMEENGIKTQNGVEKRDKFAYKDIFLLGGNGNAPANRNVGICSRLRDYDCYQIHRMGRRQRDGNVVRRVQRPKSEARIDRIGIIEQIKFQLR